MKTSKYLYMEPDCRTVTIKDGTAVLASLSDTPDDKKSWIVDDEVVGGQESKSHSVWDEEESE